MNIKIIQAIIPMASLLIFFIWAWIEGSYAHSWIIFIVSGMLMGVLTTIKKDNEEKDKREAEKGDDK